MAGPNGALAGTFKIVRAFQIISLIAIIGMAANFISDMVSNNNAPSDVLVGTLSIVCIHGEQKPRSSTDWINADMYCRTLLRHYIHPLH